MTHAHVNSDLNRIAGLRRFNEAMAHQLRERLQHAERWRDRVRR